MGLRDLLGRGGNGMMEPEAAAFVERMTAAIEGGNLSIDWLQERIAELELERDEGDGWMRLGGLTEFDFSRDHLDRIVRLSRLMWLKNPLIKRQVELQVLYVWAQGVSISGKGAVGSVVERFLNDPANGSDFVGHGARRSMERDLQVDGTVFFRLFTTPSSGRVRVRRLPVEEVRQRVPNPQDRAETWYWRRAWTDAGGKPHDVLYPDWMYRPPAAERVVKYTVPNAGAVEVDWDTPVYQLAPLRLTGMSFGVPATYAGINWARGYREFLENWQSIVKSLARWTWQAKTAGGGKAVEAMKRKLNTTLSPDSAETNPSPKAGSVAIMGEGINLEPIKTSGATISAEDGRRLLLMVAAAGGLPETFFGDASVGSLATAKSLDRPTELAYVDRQTMWATAHADILGYAIDAAARASWGGLRIAGEDPDTGVITLPVDPDTQKPMVRAVDVDWPPILQRDTAEQVGALVNAATMGGRPVKLLDDAELLTRMVLTYLGEDDVEDVVRRLYPQDGSEPEGIVRMGSTTAPEASAPEEQAAAERNAERSGAAARDLQTLLHAMAERHRGA